MELNFIEIIWEFYQFTISVDQQFNFMSVNIFENCVALHGDTVQRNLHSFRFKTVSALMTLWGANAMSIQPLPLALALSD